MTGTMPSIPHSHLPTSVIINTLTMFRSSIRLLIELVRGHSELLHSRETDAI